MDQDQPKESRTDRYVDLELADESAKKHPAQARPSAASKHDVGYAVKTTVCVFLLLAAIGYFSLICKALMNDYLLVLSPTAKETVPWLIRLAVSGGLVIMMVCVTAVLLRPTWIPLLAYMAGAVLFALVIGSGLTAWSAASVLASLLAYFLLSVDGQLDNQIEFSAHPLYDKKVLLCTLLSLLLAASFGLGYDLDAARRNYVIPPEINSYLQEQTMAFVKPMVASQQAPEEAKAIALQQLSGKVKETIDAYEKKIEPYKSYVPLVMGALAFSVFQIFMVLLGLAVAVLLGPVFFLLKATRFARVSIEVLPVRRLTLRSVSAARGGAPAAKSRK